MAGMPLVTVDAPPMNEYHPLRALAPSSWQWGFVLEGQPVRIPAVSPEALASVCRLLHGSDIRAASMDAHHWTRGERSWQQAVGKWRGIFKAAMEVDNDRQALLE
jgi:hypothetical protein